MKTAMKNYGTKIVIAWECFCDAVWMLFKRTCVVLVSWIILAFIQGSITGTNRVLSISAREFTMMLLIAFMCQGVGLIAKFFYKMKTK